MLRWAYTLGYPLQLESFEGYKAIMLGRRKTRAMCVCPKLVGSHFHMGGFLFSEDHVSFTLRIFDLYFQITDFDSRDGQ